MAVICSASIDFLFARQRREALATGLPWLEAQPEKLAAGCNKSEADAVAAFNVTVVGLFGQSDGEKDAEAADAAFFYGRFNVRALSCSERVEWRRRVFVDQLDVALVFFESDENRRVVIPSVAVIDRIGE